MFSAVSRTSKSTFALYAFKSTPSEAVASPVTSTRVTPPSSITESPALITAAALSVISYALPLSLYSDICCIAAASAVLTSPPLTTTSAASSRSSRVLPIPVTSAATAFASSTTSKLTSAVKLAKIAPSLALTTRSPRPSFTGTSASPHPS